MAARPRIKKRANWPANLHEPRPGYYTFRDPRDGRVHTIGRVPLAQAIFEVHQANAKIAAATPAELLAERIDVGAETMNELLVKMPTEGLKPNTLHTHGVLDKHIKATLGDTLCAKLTTKDVAALLDDLYSAGKHRLTKMVRARLIKVCRKGIALGWMSINPAEVTESGKVKVRRSRLTFEVFQAIRARASEVAPWLENAMLLALVSGQDRSTVASWTRSTIKGNVAVVHRSKTEISIAIPLSLRMDALGMSLQDVVTRCRATGVVSQHLIHRTHNSASGKRGDPVPIWTITAAFRDARRLAGIPEEGAPTFHEIRSLAKRMYVEQGNVDTKALLGHLSDTSADLYSDPRGIAPIKVNIR